MLKTPSGSELESTSHDSFFDSFGSYSYIDLASRATHYKQYLPGNTIVFALCNNSFETLSYYLACLNANVSLLLLPASIANNDLLSYIDVYKPSCIYSSNELNLEVLDFDPTSNLYISKQYHKFPTNATLPTLLLPTSGSTGSPKLVKISSQNLSSNTLSIINYLDVKRSSRHITSLPFNYTYGLSCVNTHLSVGASIILTDSSVITPQFWSLSDTLSPTTFSGVPYVYEMLSRFSFERLSELSISIYTQAGGKLKSNVLEYFSTFCQQYNRQFFVMYGQTEATARMSYLPSSMLSSKLGSIGVAIPGGMFSLDYSASPIESHNGQQVGELIYTGPNVTPGYANSLANLPISSSKKSLQTGDLAYVDHDGYYFIVGRLSRFSKINGIRMSLDDIQSLLPSNTAVVSDDINIYIFHENVDFDPSLESFLSATLSLPKKVFRFIPISAIPRNDAGKVLFSQLSSLV